MWEQPFISAEKEVRAPASDAAIAEFESASGKKLPVDYSEFLKTTNGGEGWFGEAYAQLWRAEELISLNDEYEVDENVPGLLLFGSNGAGEAFAFDTRNLHWTVVVVPFIVMQFEDARPGGVSFTDFVERLRQYGTCLF